MKKLNNIHICLNVDMYYLFYFCKIKKYIDNFAESIIISVDSKMEDDYIRISLEECSAHDIKKWSQPIHIDKIENFLKLKCFL